MDYWKKFLLDETTELGTDELIDEGKASWTRGRQDISAVEISFNEINLLITSGWTFGGFSDWKQSDRYLALVIPDSPKSATPIRIARQLSCRIGSLRHFVLSRQKDGSYTLFGLENRDEREIIHGVYYEAPEESDRMECRLTRDNKIVISFSGVK